MTLWHSSSTRLYDNRVDTKLQRLFDAVVADWPFSHWEFQIGRTGAYRTEDQQRAQVQSGASKTMQSKHREGKAIDITLYWAGTERAIWDRPAYLMVSGYIHYIASQLGVSIRWGGDWNSNGKPMEEDNWEVDLVHYEV